MKGSDTTYPTTQISDVFRDVTGAHKLEGVLFLVVPQGFDVTGPARQVRQFSVGVHLFEEAEVKIGGREALHVSAVGKVLVQRLGVVGLRQDPRRVQHVRGGGCQKLRG